MHGHQHLRRVCDFPQSAARHFEHGQFGGRAEAVLDAAEHAVGAFAVAFELEDDIDYVFEYLRAGDVAVLGDMAYEYHRNTAVLGKVQEHRCHLPDLGHRTCGGFGGGGVHGLYGIDYHQLRLDLGGLGKYVFHTGLAVDEAAVAESAQPVRPHLDLARAFLAGDVEGLQVAGEGYLEGEGGLAYARFSAYQDQGAFDQTASEQPVKFGYAEGRATFLSGGYLAQFQRSGTAAHYGLHPYGGRFPGHHALLHHSVPLPACRAAAHPLGALVPAGTAEPNCLFL